MCISVCACEYSTVFHGAVLGLSLQEIDILNLFHTQRTVQCMCYTVNKSKSKNLYFAFENLVNKYLS